MAQFGRASDLGSEGRVFKSHHPDQNQARFIAQADPPLLWQAIKKTI